MIALKWRCSVYSVDIVHGWVCDPDILKYLLVSEVGSYDESQSLMLKNLVHENEERLIRGNISLLEPK